MKLKSITLTTGIFPPDIGGPASFIPILAQKLSEKGIKVEVITLSDNKQDYSNLDYKVIPINREIKKPFRDLLVIKEIVKSAKNSDLIFSNTLAFESAIAAKLTKKKLVQKVVGDIAWERANSSGRFSGNLEEYQKAKLCFKSKLTNLYRNFGVNNSDFIITPSYYLKNIVSLWGYPKNKIEVIYNSVEFEKSVKIIPKTNRFRIISVARLIPHKGIEGIIKSLSKLDFDYEYILLGDGPLRRELENLAKKLNVNIVFKGNISKKEVANWLNSSDLFILNSSYEGLPHVVLEAMYNNCAVIASRVGGTPEVVKHMENGLLFEFNNEREIIKNIMLLKNNRKLRNKLIKNAKQFVIKFADVDFMIDRYIKIFEDIL